MLEEKKYAKEDFLIYFYILLLLSIYIGGGGERERNQKAKTQKIQIFSLKKPKNPYSA